MFNNDLNTCSEILREYSSNAKQIKNIHSTKEKIREGDVIFKVNTLENEKQSSISFRDFKLETDEELLRLFEKFEKFFLAKTNCILKESNCTLKFSFVGFKVDPLLNKDTWQTVKEKMEELKTINLKLEGCSFENESPLQELSQGKIKGKLLSFKYSEPDANAIINLGKLLKKNQWLKQFSLKNANYSETSIAPHFSPFCESLATCKNLEELELDNSFFLKDQFDDLFRVVGRLKKLKKFSLSDMFCVNSKELISKLRWDLIYSEPSVLEELDLSCNTFAAELIIDLVKTNTPGLKKINLSGTELLDKTDRSKSTCEIIIDLYDRLNEKGIEVILEDDEEQVETGGLPTQSFMGNYNSFLFQQQSEEITKRNLKNKELIEGILNNEIIKPEMLKEAFSADYGSLSLTQSNLDLLFIHLLEKKGFEKGDAPMDGACLFHSLASILNKEMGGEVFSSDFLRSEMIKYIRDNPDEFKDFIEDNEIFEKYLERMSVAKTWAGNMEIKALAFYLERPIIVYDLETYTLFIKSGRNALGKDNKLTDLDCLRFTPPVDPSRDSSDECSVKPFFIYRSHDHYNPLYLKPSKNLVE